MIAEAEVSYVLPHWVGLQEVTQTGERGRLIGLPRPKEPDLRRGQRVTVEEGNPPQVREIVKNS
jgi:hypothetical protein